MSIDLRRLKADMDAVNRFGRIADRPGINRVSFSDEDMAARRWFMDQCKAAGLEVRMDVVGNVIARWEVGEGPAVLAGSHLDSVPDGGEFDGALGCCAALEAVRSLKDAEFAPGSPIEVIAFAEEEGRFGGMLGSQAMAGIVDRDWYENAHDETGLHLHDAMRRQGLEPQNLASAARPSEEIKAYLELHIEQGPVLETKEFDIGIATGISGVFYWTVTLGGVANHSGTTPMGLRKDAFVGLAAFANRIPSIIDAVGSDQTRITIGKVALKPDFAHTIPGEAVFSMIGRDGDAAIMKAVADACREAIATASAAQGLTVDIRQESWLSPTALDAGVIDMLDASSQRQGFGTQRMPCGAGHDAQSMAALTRAGLILVPSRNGISHAPEELTSWEACGKGADVLMDAIRTLVSG